MVVTNGTQWSSSYRRIPLHGARENNPVKMNGPFFFGQQKIEVHYGKKKTQRGGGGGKNRRKNAENHANLNLGDSSCFHSNF